MNWITDKAKALVAKAKANKPVAIIATALILIAVIAIIEAVKN